MIDSYVAKSYFGEKKKGIVRNNKVVTNSMLGRNGDINMRKNPVLTCKEVYDVLKIGEIGKDDKE